MDSSGRKKRRVAFLGCSLLLLLLTWIVIWANLGPSERSSPAGDNHWRSSDPTIRAESEWVVDQDSQPSSINDPILTIAGDRRRLGLKSGEGVSVALFRDGGNDEPMEAKGYWDGILGIGDDRGGRINIDRIAAEEFPGLIASRHFTGGYLEGYILTYDNGTVSGRLWYHFDRYYCDFEAVVPSCSGIASDSVARTLEDLSLRELRFEELAALAEPGQ